jgi:hypothetical protein
MTSQEDRRRLVSSLGIPEDAPPARRYIEEGGAISGPVLAALVDRDVAERTWRRWYPAQADRLAAPAFRAALEAFLSAGAGMGYSLERFRTACQGLPEPDPEGEAWVEPFERAVAARNALDLRLHVRRDVRESLVASNAVPGRDDQGWNAIMSKASDGVFYELGIVLPRVELVADDALAPGELFVDINDARLPRGQLLPADRALVNDTADRLVLVNVRGEEARHPLTGAMCATIAAADAQACENVGLTTWSWIEYAALFVEAAVRAMPGAFVGRHLVQFYVDHLAAVCPILIDRVRKTVSHDAIAQVLRAMVDEKVSVRNLQRILEVLVLPEAPITAELFRDIVLSPSASTRMQFYRDTSQPPSTAFERRLSRVRAAMARYLSYKYSRAGNTLVVHRLEPSLEKRLADPRPLARREHAALLHVLREEIGDQHDASPPVILTSSPLRLRLRRELAAALPHVAVICYADLTPTINIQTLARIEAPELTDMFARLGPRDDEGGVPVRPALVPHDLLVERVRSQKDEVIEAASRRGLFETHAEPLMRECLDAILGELSGEPMAAPLAAALADRAGGPVPWDQVARLVLRVGRAACETVERPRDDDPDARRHFIATLARVRSATHRVARAIADLGSGAQNRETRLEGH